MPPCSWGACLRQSTALEVGDEGGSLSQPGVLRSAQQHGPEPGMETGVQPPGAECPGRPGHEPSCGAAGRLQADAGPCRDPPSGSHVLPGSREGDGQDASPRALRGTGRGSPSPRPQSPTLLVSSQRPPAGSPELWHGNSQAHQAAPKVTGTSFPLALPLPIVTAPHRTPSSSRACAVGKGQASP